MGSGIELKIFLFRILDFHYNNLRRNCTILVEYCSWMTLLSKACFWVFYIFLILGILVSITNYGRLLQSCPVTQYHFMSTKSSM
jgi:hypothetical protein